VTNEKKEKLLRNYEERDATQKRLGTTEGLSEAVL